MKLKTHNGILALARGRGWVCVLASAWLLGSSPVQSRAADTPSKGAPAPTAALRFQQEIQAFADADRAKPPVQGGILFVGSSIFREWTNAATMMAPLPVVNRAFGGSRTGDQIVWFERVVVPCAPKVIVYYCGSNDLKAGDTPEDIFERFKAFSRRVTTVFPSTRLVFVSSTRSPDRAEKWERVDRYNSLVRDYCASTPHHRFIDINPALVDAQGKPRLDLYRGDLLHFHPPAYVEFSRVIKPVLIELWAEVAPPVDPIPAQPGSAGRHTS